MHLKLPKAVTIVDVTARDGLQNLERFIPTEAKVYLVNALVDAGYKYIEVTHFSNPRNVPQFRDAEEVMKRIERKPGVVYLALTMNPRALARAVQAKQEGFGPDMIGCVSVASESLNLRHTGLTHAELWPQLAKAVEMAHQAGIKVCGAISTIFGCPIEGPIPKERVMKFAQRWLDMGADALLYSDATGEGTPDRVYSFFSEILDKFPNPDLHGIHFHENRGWGLASCLAALQAGITRFDAALGGLGGQPATIVDGVPVPGIGARYTPSDITGNVRAEDLVVMLDEMGTDIGLDVDKVLDIGRLLERMLGKRLRSYCTETGRIAKGHRALEGSK